MLGDRVAVLRKGILLQCDAPEKLRQHPADDYVADLMRHEHLEADVE